MNTNERRLDGARQGAEVPALPVSERTPSEDPYVLKVRREISDLDSSLVALVNKRLKLVGQLKRYKEEHGIGFVDLAREEWMLQYLQRASTGPLSAEGLAELYHYVLDLTKQEVLKAH
jgi:chorismate mutase